MKNQPTQQELDRFRAARMLVLSESVSWEGIGTLSEKTLHKILKLFVEPRIECHEVKLQGAVADVFNENGVTEIQTRSYDKLYPKLQKLLREHRVTVVCPLAAEKSVRWLDKKSGVISEPRKSPKKENAYDAFKLLHGIRGVIPHENLTVMLLYLSVDDYRYLNGWDKSRKRGSERAERIPSSLIATEQLVSAEDYAAYIPPTIGEQFLAKELAAAIKRSSRYTYYILKLLVACGALYEVGKQGKAVVYKRAFIQKSES